LKTLRRIESQTRLADVVLPAVQMRHLRDISASAGRGTQERGVARVGRVARGTSALFAGPAGTGKTLAAEALANELGLPLYRVDLSQVVSKYVGETEKNLGRVFDAAEDAGAVLLLDEADALLGKRSEVKDSHDRYANVDMDDLLERIESYEGLVILATNRKANLDPAFTRRMQYVVQFPGRGKAGVND
jgi:SpoVK/Ycf46/Vps4 family AAA+-type ATPase